MQPYEIVAAPYTLWVAPVGTAFPLLHIAPPAPWLKLGTNGDLSYSDEGVSVTHSETIDVSRPAGATGPIKAWRNEEDFMIGVTLWDTSLEQYQLALNGNALSTTAAGAGTPGYKSIGLFKGREITAYALIARGLSAYGDNMVAQYEVPRCFQSGSPAPVYRKGNPAGLALRFQALVDPTAASPAERFGRLRMQHQAAL